MTRLSASSSGNVAARFNSSSQALSTLPHGGLTQPIARSVNCISGNKAYFAAGTSRGGGGGILGGSNVGGSGGSPTKSMSSGSGEVCYAQHDGAGEQAER